MFPRNVVDIERITWCSYPKRENSHGIDVFVTYLHTKPHMPKVIVRYRHQAESRRNFLHIRPCHFTTHTNLLTKLYILSKIYYHTSFQKPKFKGLGVGSTS
jgi:hypothetical protein